MKREDDLVGLHIDIVSFLVVLLVFCNWIFLWFFVFANQPTVHSGGVIRGGLRLWLLALATGDTGHVTPDT